MYVHAENLPVLPELRKLDRYERRAAARRDRAVLDLLVEQIEQQLLVAKEAIFSPILMACETSGCRAWQVTQKSL
jgi:hypothetical protein